MFADILQIPVEIVDANETGALGCAIAAATASGTYSSLYEASEKMCKISKRLDPNQANADIYNKKYLLYLRAIEVLDPLWNDIKNMIAICD